MLLLHLGHLADDFIQSDLQKVDLSEERERLWGPNIGWELDVNAYYCINYVHSLMYPYFNV